MISMTENHSDHFSEEGFWNKLVKFAKAAGREVVEKALWLYYAMRRPETPAWARTIIIAALGYFIWPMDAIPDFVPMVGYADDLGALALAIGTVAAYIDDEVKKKAAEKLSDWFD